jgi:hypothetical protein
VVAKGRTKQMSFQRRLEKIAIASSLIGLAFGFLFLGCLILLKKGEEGIPVVGGIVGILVGIVFLTSAFSFWRYEKMLTQTRA